jgi:hypothetical protein
MNQAETAPAGGAEILEVILVTAGALVATLALVALGFAHRNGRTNLLRRLADFAAKDTGIAPWAALPTITAAISLIVAAIGMYWDISLHIDDGRDAGPLANPAHYLILFGLFGIFAAGWLAIVLPDGKPSPRAVRITGDWYAPLGGIALLAAAGFALLGFPLDDVWHRIFGQDVTLWGPTHLMLIGGAALTLVGTSTLVVEGRAEAQPDRNWRTVLASGRRTFAFGGLLIGLSTFQGEFDFGVPQFNLVLEPVMLAFAAGVALVGARLWIGPGAALGAALFFIVIRGAIALLVDPVWGETLPHFPLYLAEAASIELLALAAPRLLERPYTFGAVGGLLIGTVGFAAEYGWSHVWMPVAWPEGLINAAIVPTIVAGVSAGLIGAFFAMALNGAEGRGPAPTGSWRSRVALPSAGLAAIAVVVALNVADSAPKGVNAEITLAETSPAPNRTAEATVRIEPQSFADDANWVSAIGWQGGERLHLDHLTETSPGVYETSEPLPLSGTWKTLVRVHTDDALVGVPLYLPEDSAIPAEAVTSPEGTFQRPFIDETEILQRELKDDVPGYLAGIAYAIVGSIVLAIILLLGWVLIRLGDGGRPAGEARPKPARAKRPRSATGVPGAPA